MRHIRCFRHSFAGLSICLTTTAILIGPQVLRAQVAGPSRMSRESEYRISSAEEERLTPPVQRLREALSLPFREEDASARKEELSKRIDNLQEVLDLRQALTLHEWRDEDANEMVAKIDQEIRDNVEKRLADILRTALQSGQARRQMAAANFIEVIGVSIRSTVGGEPGRRTLTAALAPDLVEVLKGKNADVNAAAARALGRILPDPKVALPSLERVLRSGQVLEQRAAAEALAEMIRVADQSFKDTRRLDSPGLVVSRREVIDLDRGAVRAANQGLGNRDPDVRLRCVETLHQAGIGMGELVPFARPAEEEPVEEERGDLLPLAKALGDQGDSLGRLLRDPQPQIRLTAAHALEEMGNARLRLLRSMPRAKPEKPAGNESLPHDALLRGLRAALPALAQSLSDPQREVRLAAVEVMETLGPEAAAAAGPLTKALGDSNVFVRWSAARALANIDPELDRKAAETAVPGLAQVLFDPDVNTREAAAATLEKYGHGGAATGAVPEMARAIGEGDAQARIAVTRALIAVITADAPGAQAAIPALIKALDHPDDRVRRITAHALGHFGSLARDAEPALRRALDDPEESVRKAAAEALLTLNVKK